MGRRALRSLAVAGWVLAIYAGGIATWLTMERSSVKEEAEVWRQHFVTCTLARPLPSESWELVSVDTIATIDTTTVTLSRTYWREVGADE